MTHLRSDETHARSRLLLPNGDEITLYNKEKAGDTVVDCGSFKKVRLADSSKQGRCVWATIDVPLHISDNFFVEEKEFLQEMNGEKGVIETLAVINFTSKEGERKIGVVQPFYEGGNLSKALATDNLSFFQKIKMSLGMTEGLLNLHKHKIIHRDFKPANILVDKKRENAVVTDLGNACRFTDTPSIRSEMKCTPYYASPEMLRGEAVTEKHDAWSLGVVLHQMFIGDLEIAPPRNLPKDWVLPSMQGDPCSIEIFSVIQGLLQADPEKRMPPSEAHRILSRQSLISQSD